MLLDLHNRRFSYLRLSVTDMCNFRCSYCLPQGGSCANRHQFLTLKEIKTLVEAFALCGMKKIRVTGGEPTLRKDITEIIAICASEPGISKVALTTNAYRLPKLLPELIAAGLNALNISADSLRPETFLQITGTDYLDQIYKSIDQALSQGLSHIKLNAVLLKNNNLNELDEFLSFIKTTPVTIRFIELMQTGDNLEYFRHQHVRGTLVHQQLLASGWLQKEKEPDAGPALEFYHPDYAGSVGLIMPYDKNFCKSCNRLRVSSLGKLHLCLFADEGMDLRPMLADGDSQALAQHLTRLVAQKKVSHLLHQGLTGSTSQLAMLGG